MRMRIGAEVEELDNGGDGDGEGIGGYRWKEGSGKMLMR